MRLKTVSLYTLCFFVLTSCAGRPPIKTAREGVNFNDNSATENAHVPPAENPTSNIVNPTAPTSDTAQNSPAQQTLLTDRKVEVQLSQPDIMRLAYELGLDPKKELTSAEKQAVYDRHRLRELERSLNSNNERVQYSKVLPWLKNDAEKIEMLSIPSIEGRQVWINKNKIWSRAKTLVEYDEVVEAQDIALGMPTEYVKKSWGEPDQVEVSGNPIYRNERWQYSRQIATPQGYKLEKRLVYFEGGRVVGWETE